MKTALIDTSALSSEDYWKYFQRLINSADIGTTLTTLGWILFWLDHIPEHVIHTHFITGFMFLGALSLTKTPDMLGLAGGLLGLALATLFGVLFIRGSLRINLRYFFAITSFVLLILAVRLAFGSLHEFHEAGVLTLPHLVEEIVEFVTSDGISTLILLALVALPLVSMLPEKWLRPVASRASQ